MKIDYNDIKDSNYGDLIFESLHWTIFLAPNQSNIGTCLIALKRRCGTLEGLNDEEWLDFGKVVRKLEYSIRDSFKPVMFNWGAL